MGSNCDVVQKQKAVMPPHKSTISLMMVNTTRIASDNCNQCLITIGLNFSLIYK